MYNIKVVKGFLGFWKALPAQIPEEFKSIHQSLFATFKPGEFLMLLNYSVPKSVKNAQIIEENTESDIHLILSGKAAVTQGGETIAKIEGGQMVG